MKFISLLLVLSLAACMDEAQLTIQRESTVAKICPDNRLILEHKGVYYTYVSGHLKEYSPGTLLNNTCN